MEVPGRWAFLMSEVPLYMAAVPVVIKVSLDVTRLCDALHQLFTITS